MSHLPPGYRVLPKWSRRSLRAALLGRRAPGIDSMCHCNCWAGGGVVDSGCLLVVIVDDGDSFIGLECISSVVIHHLCKAPHDGLGLYVDITHHGIAMPATHEANVVDVDLAKEHGHGAAGAKGACADIHRLDTSAMEVEPHGLTQRVRDILQLDGGVALRQIVGCNWCTRRGLLQSVVLDTLECCSDGATEGVAATALDDLLIPCAILLGCESIRYRGSGVQFGFRAKEQIEFPVGPVGADIFEAKRRVVRGGACVLTRAEQKEKGDADHVGDGGVSHAACCVVCHLQNVHNYDDGHQLNSTEGFGIRLDLALDPEVNAAVVVLPWVRGPQSGVRLAHRA
jgi:hypothetical protein